MKDYAKTGTHRIQATRRPPVTVMSEAQAIEHYYRLIDFKGDQLVSKGSKHE